MTRGTNNAGPAGDKGTSGQNVPKSPKGPKTKKSKFRMESEQEKISKAQVVGKWEDEGRVLMESG